MPALRLEDGGKGLAGANREYSQAIYVLAALAGFVLLMACANLANLLLARSSARQRELAVRIAMGATRTRVLRQMLTESVLLSSLGGVAGFLLGYLCRNLIPRLLSSSWEPAPLNTRFDLRIFAFTATISIATGILFGLAPAWQATRTEVNSGLKDAALSATRRRKGVAGRSPVIFQIALSMLLVAGAGLFMRTLINLNTTNVGFDPRDLLLFSIKAPVSRYPAPKDIAVHGQIEDRIAGIPGVQSVTLTAEPVLANTMSETDFKPTDRQPRVGTDSYAYVNDVGRNFFGTYRIPILYGRSFSTTDTAGSFPVAVVNQAIVRHFYGSENPVGKTFKGDNDRVYRIIGVAADAKYDQIRNDVRPTFYTLFNQSTDDAVMNYAVKTRVPMNDMLPRIQAAVQQIDKDIPLRDIRTQQKQIDATLMQERLFATLTGAFGSLALTLACIGIYGTMAYNVARRTREIGVRLALGAQARRVLGMVLQESVWMAAFGIGFGVAAAFALARFVASMLFGLKPMDPLTMISAGGVLFAVALAAGYLPARTASRIDPMVVLRNE